jgi:methylenetetrahydrofolate--tRNA-(uracil-5-)-methyltransferase
MQGFLGSENLFFFDAVSPVITFESVDMEKAFFGSRYGKGGQDYLNCPMDEAGYERFVRELVGARRVTPRSFEDSALFEGCMPIESMAERGPDTLRFGPLRPVGLTDPATGRRPAAVVQLRREDREGTLYNLVGFQTRLAFAEQARVFRLIPALSRAEFVRYGKMHRNTYLDSPRVLEPTLHARREPGVFIAGQLTGTEGYCESGATGIIAGMNAARRLMGLGPVAPPPATMTGALLAHVTTPGDGVPQPMNANFGILAPIPGGPRKRRLRRKALAERAIAEMRVWRDKILAEPR